MAEDERLRPGHFFRWIIVTVLILAVLWVALPTLFFVLHPVSGAYYAFYRPFFFPFNFLFGIFLVFIIFGALRWAFWPSRWGYRRRYWRYGDEAYYILRERYARGEITKEQFEQMMQDLKTHTAP